MAKDTGNITNNEDGTFTASFNGGEQSFGTFAEAQRWLEDRSDYKEPAASEMTPEDAEEINGDVRETIPPQADVHRNPVNDNETDEPGSGNREAPQKTKTTANDDKKK